MHLNTPVRRVVIENGRVTGVDTPAKYFAADDVISTIPIPLIPKMVPDLSPELKARYQAIHSIGVICVIFRLKRSVSPHFWVNISENGIEIPGIIEFSNLRNVGGDAIVYVPYYMPITNAKFSWSDDRLCDEAFACLQRINPSFQQEDIIDIKVARLRHGQPVCEPGFAAKIPPIQTPIRRCRLPIPAITIPKIAASPRVCEWAAIWLDR